MELEFDADRMIPFQVDGQSLLKEFECTICQMYIKQAHITKCGHVFCKECVLEAINRHHRCPFCSTDLNENDVIKNYHFDNLKSIIMKAKEEVKVKIVEKGFHINKEQDQEESTVLNIFRNTLKEIVFLYELNYKEIRHVFDEKRKKIEESFYKQMNIENNIIKEDQLSDIQKQIYTNLQKQQQELLNQQNEIINHINESLNNYMKTSIPKPDILDVRMKLVIPKKNIRLESYTIKPFYQISEFRSTIISLFQKNNDPIDEQKLDPKQVFLVNIPLNADEDVVAKLSAENVQTEENIIKILQQNGLQPQIQSLSSKQLFSDLKIQQGSTLVILGIIPSHSDQPPRCLTYQFQKNSIHDYYTCVTCNLNWICKSCALFCHKDHNTVLQLKNHTASWACCYCVSKGKCQAENKNSK